MRALRLSLPLIGLLVSAASLSSQQPPDRAEVEVIVTRLFDGMRAGDSAAVRSVFHPTARLGTAPAPGGEITFRLDAVDGFVRAVGGSRTVIWDEQIANLKIEIDGPLATAWMDYWFHAGERFSHCGVNAMQLVRAAAGWQIVSLIDTRRQEGCGR